MKYLLICFLFLSCNVLKSITDGDTDPDTDFFSDNNYDDDHCDSSDTASTSDCFENVSLEEDLLAFYRFENFASQLYDTNGLYTLNNVALTSPDDVTSINGGNAANFTGATANSNGIFYYNGASMSFSSSANYAFSFHSYESQHSGATLSTVFHLTNGSNILKIDIGDLGFASTKNDIQLTIGSGTWLWQDMVPSNQWVHVAMNINYGGSSVDLYIDGVYVSTESNSPYSADGNIINIGTEAAGGNMITYYLDSFGIWNRKLTQDEISDLAAGSTTLD